MAEKKMVSGRYRRLAQVGGTVGGQAAKRARTRAVNLVRSDEQATAALARHHIQTAEQIVAVLGNMKGAAMKVGQMLSVLDLGLVADEHREEFQRKLGALRDTVPTMPFRDMGKVIEEELGGRLGETFADFDEEPIAAASIGQVYRARLNDGRDVAVKVQYPRVAAAIRADMQNLGLIVRLLGRLAPQLDTRALLREVREEISEELDYELEASNQRSLARIYAGHPFIVLPAVVSDLCGARMIVTHFIDGERFAVLEGESVEERNRLGEIIFRFYLGSMYRHRKFSGDPHPGNFLRQRDGKLAFLDFGLFKQMDREPIEFTLGILRAVTEANEAELHRLLSSARFLPDRTRFDPAELMSYMLDAYWWCTRADRELTITPELSSQVLAKHLGPRSSNIQMTRQMDVNPEHLLGRRLELLVLAVLGQLKATANWHRIAREWIYDEAPITELGRQEAEFFGAPPR